jgi:hypothetical protein
MAKNLLGKYVWLVETIYNARQITFEEINQKWLDDDMDVTPIPLRTFHKWRIAAEEMFGLVIDCERKGGYHYYIGNAREVRDGGLRSWLLSTISVSNLLLDSQQLKDRIILEDIPSGQHYLPKIIEAMKSNAVITITYQSYWREESNTFDVYPYCVKLFRQRWYLVALSPYYDKVMIYSLDRIFGLQKKNEKFTMPDDFDPTEFFQNYYGVIAGTKGEPETVKIKISAGQANYLRSLKLHATQDEIERTDEYSIFSYRLRAEYDFIMELLSKGEDVEVLEPVWLRNEMAGIVKRMWDKYNDK